MKEIENLIQFIRSKDSKSYLKEIDELQKNGKTTFKKVKKAVADFKVVS